MKPLLIFLLTMFVSFTTVNDEEIKMIKSSKLAIIQVIFNKKKAFFIVDTGASLSVLDESQKECFNFVKTEEGDEVTGYGGTSSIAKAEFVDVSIGKRDIYAEWKCKNLSAIVDVIERHDGIKISGVIGNDIIKRYNFVIDYRANIITLN